MIVAIEEIGRSGLSRTQVLGADALNGCLREAGEIDWEATGEGVFEAAFEKLAGKVLMKARALVHLRTACKRCLSPLSVDLPFEFTAHFVNAPAPLDAAGQPAQEPKRLRDEVGTGASFDLASADDEPFDGRTIDTAELFREQLLLNLPMGLVCREDCKGLCPICGERLDKRACDCDRRPIDPRWEALRAIKLAPPKP